MMTSCYNVQPTVLVHNYPKREVPVVRSSQSATRRHQCRALRIHMSESPKARAFKEHTPFLSKPSLPPPALLHALPDDAYAFDLRSYDPSIPQ